MFYRLTMVRKYRNPWECAVSIYKTSGVRALYYGMPAFLVQTSGKGTVRFTAFEQYRMIAIDVLGIDREKHMFAIDGIAGFLAGMTEATVSVSFKRTMPYTLSLFHFVLCVYC